ncbi:hypothetical protein DVH26_00705 [Paenibacillus sp. H1-7]|uniref:hypothetical protein n=1 Tax=Paenibacillus sp. H1-7 TaxID=2282849 RepID=UPI001EF9822F|nr:hypothetical protein [Paenibacillus sp. H1-7]ULL13127.1 hypothetical protein DVH26_00705 [Paenibacillus sp. H1-7]
MMSVKDSDNKADMEALHTELWSKLQDRDEAHAKQLLQRWIGQLDLPPRLSVMASAKEMVFTKGFWVAVFVGCTLAPLLFTFIVWAALLVE